MPTTKTQTRDIVIELPRETRDAAKRVAGGLLAAAVGGYAAFHFLHQAKPEPIPAAPAIALPALIPAKKPAAKASGISADERAERVRRDIFFSNFAETQTPDFGGTEPGADDLARFAARHAVINTPERVQTDGNGFRYVGGAYVAQTAERYFGEVAPVAPGKDYLLTPADAAPAAPRFARVEGWKPLPGGKTPRFAASVRVYEPPTGWKTDPFSWTMTDGDVPNAPKLVGVWNATVAKTPGVSDTSSRYVLLSWKRL